ncbi:MAG: Trm112 family protein, partial [Thermofilaceae archaeon]
MKYRLMDLLACPYDKSFPLELFTLKINKYSERTITFKKKPACELYCAFQGKKIEELHSKPDCDECIKYEVSEGVLFCRVCNRWFPIIDEIPIL